MREVPPLDMSRPWTSHFRESKPRFPEAENRGFDSRLRTFPYALWCRGFPLRTLA